MALTNPEKVVTEQRLNEYHQTILPYLGGMPDILANKFNKSDLYSTDETIIGQWIDGKPLYQQVIATTFASGTIYTITDATISPVLMSAYLKSDSKSVQENSFVYSSDNTWCVWVDNNVILGAGKSSYSGRDLIIILQYTKTTDSPIAIGSDTDYSTTEKIVGTWIDGKELWQRTFVLQSAMTVPANTQWHDTGMSNDGIDEIVNLSSVRDGVTTLWGCVNIDKGTSTLVVQNSRNANITLKEFTLQYTKTTD